MQTSLSFYVLFVNKSYLLTNYGEPRARNMYTTTWEQLKETLAMEKLNEEFREL